MSEHYVFFVQTVDTYRKSFDYDDCCINLITGTRGMLDKIAQETFTTRYSDVDDVIVDLDYVDEVFAQAWWIETFHLL